MRTTFKDILDYFVDEDVFIFNNTKVFPARLYGKKEKTWRKRTKKRIWEPAASRN